MCTRVVSLLNTMDHVDFYSCARVGEEVDGICVFVSARSRARVCVRSIISFEISSF